jgi:N-hydroxyarylamine O-acetyltransferase
MILSDYFDRIGYSGPRTPDFTTLDALMRAHIAAVPFENLDVQLGNPVTIDIPSVFAKLVGRRRGGWCYENNGLFGRVLSELGFDVRRLSAGVLRSVRGDVALGNHLVLVVTIDGKPWLVDVGFGGTQAAPIPLAEGETIHPPFLLALRMLDDGYWRLEERYRDGDPFGFDFRADAADEALLAQQCEALQSEPDSIFVQNLVVQRRLDDRHLTLRGRVLLERGTGGETRHLIGDAAEFVTVLRERFGLDMPETAALWDKVCARHAELFAEET